MRASKPEEALKPHL